MSISENIRIVRVFVASPGDVLRERKQLRSVVEQINAGETAKRFKVIFEIVEWDQVAPGMGRPEDVILDAMPVDTWDVVIAILWTRFGTPSGAISVDTGRVLESGTEEEFQLAYRSWRDRGRPLIRCYRCIRAPRDLTVLDGEQYKRVCDFFKKFDAVTGMHPGLYHSYKKTSDFALSIYRHLSDLIFTFHRPEFERKPWTPDQRRATRSVVGQPKQRSGKCKP